MLRQMDYSIERLLGYMFEQAIYMVNSFQFTRSARLMLAYRPSGSDSRSLELLHRRCLIGADAPDFDFRHEKILAARRAPCHAAQHGDLSDVGQRIGHRTLKQELGLDAEWAFASQAAVEGFQQRKESRDVRVPRHELRAGEFLDAVGHVVAHRVDCADELV